MTQDLDFTSWHVGVNGTVRTVSDAAGNFNDIFITDRIGNSKRVRSVGIKHNLCYPFTVSKVNEDYATVVPATMNPST
jgi:hypothetical protein